MSSQTISQYYNTKSNEFNNFIKQLKEKQYRDEFFDKYICVMRLGKNVRAYTNRYLNIVINYSGLEKIRNYKFNKEEVNIEDFSNEDRETVELINETLPRKVEVKETLIFLQSLKSMLLLTIILEFNHLITNHINEDITKCVTDRDNIFSELFGQPYFKTLTYEQAVYLYDINNWESANSLKQLTGEEYSKTSKCSLQCLGNNEERGPCVEHININK